MGSLQIHTACWHGDLHTPVVDNKYVDPKTGELQTTANYVQEHGEPGYYDGPPSVDIIIQNIHADTVGRVYRKAQPFPMGALLASIMKVITDERLDLDSVVATRYAIRIVLSHELTKEEFGRLARRMIYDIYDER